MAKNTQYGVLGRTFQFVVHLIRQLNMHTTCFIKKLLSNSNDCTFTLHGNRTGTEYRDQMETIVPCRTVHTGLRQGQVPGPIVSYCASSVPCPGPGPILVQCEWGISLVRLAVYFAHLSVAHCWYFGCMLELDVPVGVILNGSGKTGRYGLDGVDGDISWFRNICIWRSYIWRCFSRASVFN